MQIVINIPDNYFNLNIENGSIASQIILKAVKNGTPLPPNATNGEVMKMIFGAEEIGIINSLTDQIVVRMSDKYDRRFDLGWWNAPYKTDKE